MAKVGDLSKQSIKALNLPPAIENALIAIQGELADAYRESFVQMVKAINVQTSSIERIQRTLEMLVGAIAPKLTGQIPPAIRVADDGEDPDIASAIVVADPIAAGYTLTQAALAQALGIPQPYVSILCRIFKLKDDERYAVTVRKGVRREIVNYHPRAIDRVVELLTKPPPASASAADRAAIERARRKLLSARQAAPAISTSGPQ